MADAVAPAVDERQSFAEAAALEQTDPIAAGERFLTLAARSPLLFEAYFRALRCALRLVRQGRAAPNAKIEQVSTPAKVSVVCCSVTPSKVSALKASLDRVLADWEFVVIDDARSLCEGYTRGMTRARGDLLLFCHDDIRVLSPDFALLLQQHAARFDVFGVAGSIECRGPAALWAGPPNSQGWVAYSDGARQAVSISGALGPVVAPAQALDGVFIAARRDVAHAVAWDADTFDGFHLYDIDFSLRANLRGYRVAICLDLLVEHASRGGFDANWKKYAQRFAAKFPSHCTEPHFAGPNSIEIEVKSDAEIVGTYAWLRYWLLKRTGCTAQ